MSFASPNDIVIVSACWPVGQAMQFMTVIGRVATVEGATIRTSWRTELTWSPACSREQLLAHRGFMVWPDDKAAASDVCRAMLSEQTFWRIGAWVGGHDPARLTHRRLAGTTRFGTPINDFVLGVCVTSEVKQDPNLGEVDGAHEVALLVAPRRTPRGYFDRCIMGKDDVRLHGTPLD
ncbi:hypothetical protein HYS28_01665 [Candidatus Uhrbacteria bacterium]|nr:hypothetical protein [Candidatus Uhrbacteria bacterium]